MIPIQNHLLKSKQGQMQMTQLMQTGHEYTQIQCLLIVDTMSIITVATVQKKEVISPYGYSIMSVSFSDNNPSSC